MGYADMEESTVTIRGPTQFRLGDVDISFMQAGSAEGELVILLHGFPEYWGAWRRQMTRLAAAGFLVVAPDQRGYGLSGKPPGISEYDLDYLADDIVGLARHLGRQTFSLVGHDWGGSVAWWIASRDPSVLRCIAVINSPHPAVWREAMERDWRQWLRSLYVRVMRLPKLPEMMLRSRDFQALAQALEPAKFSADDMANYRLAWSQPGALTGMINWYRAFLARRLPAATSFAIDVPTLIIWGDKDFYAVPQLADISERLCRNAQIAHFPLASHWVHHEQSGRVGDLIETFLLAPRADRA